MYVQSITSNNVSMNGKNPNGFRNFYNRAKQKAFDMLPKADLNAKNLGENLDKFNEMLSSPAINRGIMGGTALIFQPYIDAKNHRVDEETKEVSVNRIIAKTIIGTAVGIVVREGILQIVKKFTNLSGKDKYSTALLPKTHFDSIKRDPVKLGNYRSALATIMALGVMMFTNFLIDAPLTKLLTNYFNDKKLSKKLMGKEEKVA